tara:strand:- start:323 stop:430 length:108 start_codon:yes stop_codon:yes gene_type:complete
MEGNRSDAMIEAVSREKRDFMIASSRKWDLWVPVS